MESKRQIPEKERQKRKKKIIAAATAVVIIGASILITCLNVWNAVFSVFHLGHFSDEADDYPFSIHFLDVGKADCALIECSGSFALVDCGSPGDSDTVIHYLKRRNADTLTYAFGTHPDNDHTGGYPYLLKHINTNIYMEPIMSDEVADDEDERNIKAALQDKNILYRSIKAGDSFKLSEAEIKVISPSIIEDTSNNSSLVLMITYKNTRFLMMGDAETEIERKLLGKDIQADVIKIGHHGSKTSSCEEFLKKVNPKYAVVSVGSDKHNLPSDDVMYRLDELKFNTLRTDTHGTVIAASDGENIKIITEK